MNKRTSFFDGRMWPLIVLVTGIALVSNSQHVAPVWLSVVMSFGGGVTGALALDRAWKNGSKQAHRQFSYDD